MAKVYKINRTTQAFEEILEGDTIQLPDCVKLTHYSSFNADTILDISTNYPHHDTFQHTGKLEMPIHYHDDDEVRVILRGIATFYVPLDQYLYIIECSCLDKLELAANIVHWFSADGDLLAFRFFSNNTQHIMKIPEALPPDVYTIKDHIDKNGLNLKFNV